MTSYRIEIMKPARKFIERQIKPQQERLVRALYRLPHDGDIKLLAGQDNVYRLRIGGYRVIYTVCEEALTVRILTAGNRGDVYKG